MTERLDEWRVVTLTGSGGVGKTRLALRVAEERLKDFADGVWLAELAPLSEPALVAQLVAAAAGVRDQPGRPVLEILTVGLQERQVLLVLDNCEHLLADCARLVEAVLRQCPRVKVLATSREALSIAGEASYLVPSLLFPNPDLLPAIERLSDYDAISLFVDRARALVPDYQAAAHNARALARICQRLDGIPLAIEMAAAWINTLSAEQLADRLEDAFRLLTSGSRTALPRHRTLRGMLDWSYALLQAEERLLLQRLSAFAGGCTLEAAEAICGGDGLERERVLALVAALVAKSLVLADRRAGAEARYHLLEMVRQYAWERLEDGSERNRLQRRHRDYFLEFARTHDPRDGTAEARQLARKLPAEFDNLRLALEWSFNDLTEAETILKFVVYMRGNWPTWQDEYDFCQRAIAVCENRADIPPRHFAALLENGCPIVVLNDPPLAVAWARRAVDISRGLGPDGLDMLEWTLVGLGEIYLADGKNLEAAFAAYAEAEAIFNEIGPARLLPEQYQLQRVLWRGINGSLAIKQGHYAHAARLCRETLQLLKERQYQFSPVYLDRLLDLGYACLLMGECDQAREHFLEAVQCAAALADMLGDNRKTTGIYKLGLVELRQGNWALALDYYQTALEQAKLVPDYNLIAACLGLCAAIRAGQGQLVPAATLSGASQAMFARQGRAPWEDFSLDTLLPSWREAPNFDTVAQAFEAGQAFTNQQAVSYAESDQRT